MVRGKLGFVWFVTYEEVMILYSIILALLCNVYYSFNLRRKAWASNGA